MQPRRKDSVASEIELDERVIKGDGRSSHRYARYGIALPLSEYTRGKRSPDKTRRTPSAPCLTSVEWAINLSKGFVAVADRIPCGVGYCGRWSIRSELRQAEERRDYVRE